MTFIKIDPTALRLALTKVSSFATSYEQSASSIRSKNLVEGYPADLSSLATADTSVGELKTTVSEIKTRIKSAEQIGSSGITFSEAPTGTYCIGSLCIKTFFYVVPDGQSDTVENVKAAASSITDAGADAKLLQDAVNRGDHAAIKQIVDEKVHTHTDDGVYAAALADGLAPRNTTLVSSQIMFSYDASKGNLMEISDEEMRNAVPTLQTWCSMFAAATNSGIWSSRHREEYAHKLAKLVTTTAEVTDETTESARRDNLMLPIGFNLLLTGGEWLLEQHPEISDDALPGSPVVLDAGFLTTLARDVMVDETTGNSQDGWREYAGRALAAPEPRHLDPMTGILEAMGHQPQAALDFLAPPLDYRDIESDWHAQERANKGPRVDVSPWKWISERQKDAGVVGLEALTQALAGASALRQLSSTTIDERAAWLTEKATVYLANSVGTENWSDTARRNAATMLANCVADLDATADKSSYSTRVTAFDKTLPHPWSARHEDEVAHLLQKVLIDDTSLAIVAEAAGKFSNKRTLTEAERTKTDSLVDSFNSVLATAKQDAKLYGLLFGARQKAEELKGDKNNKSNSLVMEVIIDGIAAGISAVPFISGVSITAKLAASALSAIIAAGATVAKSAIPSNNSDTKDDEKLKEFVKSIKTLLHFKALGAVDSTHIIPQEDYEAISSKVDWIVKNDDGLWTLDWDKAIADKYNFNKWLDYVCANNEIPPINDAVIGDSFSSGMDAGKK